MRIFIFTTCFAPSIGGIERLTELLAAQFTELGHDVALATPTPGPDRGPWSFPVVRQPTPRRFWSLLRWCDVHLQANLSLKYFPGPLGPRPLVVTHQNDYAAASGRRGLRGRLKLACARLVHGIACSRYIARRVGCREVIGNPYDDAIFRRQAPLDRRDRDIDFLGRLVSDKGCDTLLEALAILKRRRLGPSCTVIGAGPERARLTAMTTELGLEASVRFHGALQGAALARELNRYRLMVAPSRYCEPFGIVALEALACGCLPIVSEHGGLVDAIGGHGLTFRNGDALDLADRLELALGDGDLARRKLAGVDRHLEGFKARSVAEKYLGVFDRISRESSGA
jgi:glycosyltransferase involved in cell wall biosynthesis